MRIGILKTIWNFFSQNFETFAGSFKDGREKEN
jgi:hypothetical protein